MREVTQPDADSGGVSAAGHDEPVVPATQECRMPGAAGNNESGRSDLPPAEDDPDVGFTLAEPTPEQDVVERARALMHTAARELSAAAPEGWQRLDAVFASTVAADVGFAVFADAEGRTVRWTPTPRILSLVREHRQLSAELGEGPWWRLLLILTSDGQIEVDYDYGDEPFPADQLFAPEIYRADLEVFPRETLPVWLAAYLRHDGRQQRPPRVASARARADRDAGAVGTVVAGLPPFPVLAARWAVLAAAFVAVGSEWGPRLTPALRWFEGVGRSGSTLCALPGGRAVLSGGVWNAAELDAAYNRAAPLPELFRGAPEWVADQVVNHRAGTGQLTFCYWWDGRNWFGGESPDIGGIAAAVPGFWDADTVVRIVSGLLGADPPVARQVAVERLVEESESGAATRAALAEVFAGMADIDIDSAAYQLVMGGVTAPDPLPEQVAVERVTRYLADSGADSPGYRPASLRAERVRTGWMVYVPVEPGEIAVGRAIFYLADDGVLEHSSSSVAPSLYLPDFERRFRERNRALA